MRRRDRQTRRGRDVVSEGRMLPLLAPALVLYLLANLASGPALDPTGWALALEAALLSLVPALAVRREAMPGARRIAWMGFAGAIAAVGQARQALSLPLELAAWAPVPWACAMAADLAFDVPDEPPRLARFA